MEPHQNIALSFKCPKQLNQLHPVNGDYYCDGCLKLVHDFRGMTETQVLEVMAGNSRRTCGIFEPESIKVLPQIPKWIKWASALMLALGITACNNVVMGKAVRQDKPTLKGTDNNRQLIGVIMPGSEASFRGGETALKKYIYQHLKNPN